MFRTKNNGIISEKEFNRLYAYVTSPISPERKAELNRISREVMSKAPKITNTDLFEKNE
jgi:hypothetical protein